MIRAFLRVCKASEGGAFSDPAFRPVGYDADRMHCPGCGSRGTLAPHAGYSRHYVSMEGDAVTDTLIEVARLRCSSCGTTHAVLPLTAVPRSVFSVLFIASLIADHINRRFPGVESLCAHYGVAVNTFYRIRGRFLSCVRIVSGILAAGPEASAAAAAITGGLESADAFLASFFELTGTSFCEPRGP